MLYCFCVCVNLCNCHLVTNVTDGPQMFSVFIDTESSDLSTPEGELESQEKHIKKRINIPNMHNYIFKFSR